MNYNIQNKYYTCKYDRPFKKIFINEENKEMLKENLPINQIVKITKLSKEEIEKSK